MFNLQDINIDMGQLFFYVFVHFALLAVLCLLFASGVYPPNILSGGLVHNVTISVIFKLIWRKCSFYKMILPLRPLFLAYTNNLFHDGSSRLVLPKTVEHINATEVTYICIFIMCISYASAYVCVYVCICICIYVNEHVKCNVSICKEIWKKTPHTYPNV